MQDRPTLLPYLFLTPLVLYLALFQAVPLAQEIIYSFTSTSLLTPKDMTFVGMRNYRDLIEIMDFGAVLRVTLVYTLACLVLAIGSGLGVALLMNRPFRGRGIARALVTMPWAAPSVAVALVFTWMYNAQYGIFSRLQRSFGLPSGQENWLDSPDLALPAVLIATIWQIFPFSAVVILAALQGVSEEQREAAILDGAGPLDVYKTVTWPTIRPTVGVLALFVTIWSLRRFDLIWLMTQGGPIGRTNTLVIELYRQAFVYRDLGMGAAVGVVGLVIAILVTLGHLALGRRRSKQP